jgi:hypothetical protein
MFECCERVCIKILGEEILNTKYTKITKGKKECKL